MNISSWRGLDICPYPHPSVGTYYLGTYYGRKMIPETADRTDTQYFNKEMKNIKK